jgi:DNA-binding transcriptional regulator YiaG
MPSNNLNRALKEEIERVARKLVRSETMSTRRAVARHRTDIAALKRSVSSLQKKVKLLEKQEKRRLVARPSPKLAEGARFSPARLKRHRERLGLSAADYSRLVGVHQITIYNWEQGKSRPRKEQLAALVAVRGLKKREARMRLAMLRTKAG